ncbi:MAG: MFS transporter [Afipia sp.]|nr:MFS transporter [Afipia sp.]OJW65609.1 MAG: MFS transporter [Afipia sp. 64-13]
MSSIAGLNPLMSGPHRAVAVLCVTQILGWGALFYPPALTMTHIAAAHGWSLALALSGFSISLGISGLVAPYACGLIDRHGGNPVMAGGALIGAAGLLLLPFAPNFPVYVLAWVLIGVATASTLYDPAFTTLTRIFGMNARRPITLVTFAGGLASTISWPVMHFLIEAGGWQLVYYAWAAVFVLVVAPLHGFALPRHGVHPVHRPADTAAKAEVARTIPARGWPFFLMAAGFAGHAFVLSGTTTHLLTILQRGGIDAGLAVTIGALFGPSQVVTRFADFISGGRLHAVWVARISMGTMVFAFALLVLVGITPLHAVLFAILFGAANGVMTIARGALPLSMFGPVGFGRVVGRISRPGLILQAAAPFVLAFAMDRWSDQAALEIMVVMVLLSLGCFAALRRP